MTFKVALKKTNQSKIDQPDPKACWFGFPQLTLEYVWHSSSHSQVGILQPQWITVIANTPNNMLWECQSFFAWKPQFFRHFCQSVIGEKACHTICHLLPALIFPSQAWEWSSFCHSVYLVRLVCFSYSTFALKLVGQMGRNLNDPSHFVVTLPWE